jgi:hypothetical protein
MDAKQTPLIDLLERVPVDARLVIDAPDGMGSTLIPIGRLCREAITALRAALAQEQPDTDCHTQGICQRSGYSIGAQQEQEVAQQEQKLPPLPSHPEHAWLWTEAEKMMIRAYAAQAVAERDAEIASLREANERFGQRQEWWTEKMFQLEQERDALKAEVKALREANDTFARNSILPDHLCIMERAEVEALRADADKHYAAGWIAAAKRAERDDLISDIDSPAYIADRDAAIDRARSKE